MKGVFVIAAIVGLGLPFATPANAGKSSPSGTNSGTIVFAAGDCQVGYEWNEKEQKCMKAERDY